jgi:hypothetical protein
MRINSSTTYISLGIIGLVISLLYFQVAEDRINGILALFITLTVLCTLRFFLEWKRYKNHNAILASSQFLILPFIVIFFGSIISPMLFFTNVFEANYRLLGDTFGLVVNLITLLLLIPMIVLSRLFYFYHNKLWLGFAIKNKIYRSRTLPYFFNMFMAGIMVLTIATFETIDLNGKIVVIQWIYHSLKYYILPIFKRSRRSEPTQRFSKLDEFLSNTPTRNSRNYNNQTSTRTSIQTTRSRNIPVTSRQGQRNISTNYKNSKPISARSSSHRDIPISSRTQKSTSKGSKNSKVERTEEVKVVNKPKPNVNNLSYLPIGNVTKDDLACIICYDAFKPNSVNVILCKFCKYPAHESEFLRWMQSSTLCPRCAKSIPSSYINSPEYKLSSKEYVENYLSKL